MTIGHLTRNAVPPSNILTFEYREDRADGRHDRALAKQETELREALAKVQALRRQHDELMQLSGGAVRACSPREKPPPVTSPI